MSGVKETVAQTFGSAAEAYRTSEVHARGADLPRMVELAGLSGREVLLDAGCGAGHAAAAVAPHARSVVAVDLSDEMLAVTASLAAGRGLTNLSVRRADVEALPFDDGSFDRVVSRYSAHHWPHPAVALAEIRRVLRPGGRFILSDIVSWDEPAVDSYLQAIEVLRDPSHVRDHSATQWFAFLQDAGFSAHIAERFPVRIDFEPWVQRINTPAPHLAALRSLLLGAPDEVRAALAVKTDCSFTLQGTLFAAEVPQP